MWPKSVHDHTARPVPLTPPARCQPVSSAMPVPASTATVSTSGASPTDLPLLPRPTYSWRLERWRAGSAAVAPFKPSPGEAQAHKYTCKR
eukprot:2241079-Rhodomonas_salina.1